MTDPRVVVGASHAGAELAVKLRQLDPATPVLVVGEEPVLPYQRPPLSKGWLANPDGEVEALLIRNAAAYESAGIAVRTGTRVTRIDRAAQRLELDSGEAVPYAQLAIATGARARRLALPGTERAERAANFHYLRTLADAHRLRAQIESGARIVIIGGGYIGLELAALAIKRGLRPVVLEAQSRVLARVTAAELSVFYEKVHRDAGVDVRTGVQVAGFEFAADGRVCGVLWQDASGASGSVGADIIVAGVGVVPNVELAQAAGLVCAPDGLLVDELCRTSDPAIVAAGDCTSRPVPGQPGTARIESVPNAAEQARSAAATLCGLQQPCNVVPWFWSDQYDLKLQMVGLSRGHDAVVIRGDMAARAFTAFYLRAGTVIAADAVNRPADFMLARKLVTAGARADAVLLADPATELKKLVAA
ncbi:MAG: FAD-dependent oxidoreductase [Pseudomonadota bacterium]|nr:FAD-dependent oxidoreductase [Pseudomonadota bacterium]